MSPEITKAQVQAELKKYGIKTRPQVMAFLKEPRQYEKNNGTTIMGKILADLGVTDHLAWVSRRRVRHWTKLLLAEGKLS